MNEKKGGTKIRTRSGVRDGEEDKESSSEREEGDKAIGKTGKDEGMRGR